ncbi:PhnB protein putative DNA binding 3-demethylubiquinone-9 3-methyltransferase domain protein [Candidatus Burkholderia verschuerenii]|uniref:PhnB protein putative DNA binding 3-demethylubiquinone-9 3-methyltransferase domain protein n=1 Tax=Candidatus Burkholderia verschuerenii TaxID=242163 RepID=A0A0L0MAX8_9BURK|nr:PhnB protein putative DNA binding 3-demethylubiquinone-9 3-methyltransferase domain protein [Candidatus Burkholderia verschuerenii]
MQVQPYLFFEGRCEEAITFYREHLGAQTVMMMRFKENPEAGKAQASEGCGMPAGSEDKIMHYALMIGDSMIMASDGMCSGKPNFAGISLSLTANDEQQAEKYFAALGNGGQVQMAMTQTFFAKRFGMVQDKFGVSWMVLGGMESQLAYRLAGTLLARLSSVTFPRRGRHGEQLRRTFAGRSHCARQASEAAGAGAIGRRHGQARHRSRQGPQLRRIVGARQAGMAHGFGHRRRGKDLTGMSGKKRGTMRDAIRTIRIHVLTGAFYERPAQEHPFRFGHARIR